MNDRSVAAQLYLLAFGNFVIGTGAFVVIGMLQPIADGLDVSNSDARWVMTSYSLAYAVLSPIAAALTGAFPRRIVLSLGLGLFFIGALASALSPTLMALTGARVPTALGGALFTPLAAGVAVSLVPPEMRGRALATVFGGVTLAQVIGTPLGSWLAFHFGWQSTFFVVAALSLIALVLLLISLPKAVPFQPASFGVILRVLSNGRVMLAVAYTATLMISVYQVFTFFGPVIAANTSSNPEVKTAFLLLYGGAAFVANIIGGRLSDWFGSVQTLLGLGVFQMLVIGLFFFTPMGPLPFGFLIAVWALTNWSFMAPQQARLVALFPEAPSLVLALNAAAIYIGIAIGSWIGGLVLERFGLSALGISGALLGLLALANLAASAAILGDWRPLK